MMHEVCYAGSSNGGYLGIKAKEDRIQQALNDAKKAEQAFNEAYRMTKELVSFIEGSEWHGEYKESVYNMINIMASFQGDLNGAISEHVEAIDALYQSLSEYDALSITQAVRGVNV